MSPSTKKPRKPVNLDALLALMVSWPKSWAGTADDIPIGETIVNEMKPFITHLASKRLTAATVRRHLDNCWVIGGEIIRHINYYPEMAKTEPCTLLLDSIRAGEAPLVHDASEEEQRAFDATARKLLRFFEGS